MLSRRSLFASGLGLSLANHGRPSRAQATTKPVLIGVLNDQGGDFSANNGVGSNVATQLAIEAMGGKVAGRPVEFVAGDHQNKPDVGLAIAREWFDQGGVDVICDLPVSSIGLAVSDLARQKNKVMLSSLSGTPLLTGEKCSPNTVQWTYDTYALANGTARAVVKSGGDTWFFITADYGFGYSLEADTRKIVEGLGGKVLGSVRAPFAGTDFSAFILAAQASGAKIIALANTTHDAVETVKQCAEFGVRKGGQTVVGLILFITDVHALPLEQAQGLLLTTPFYWDRTDATRTWSREFARRRGGAMPAFSQAGVFGSVLHYLKAVDAVGGPEDGRRVVDKMKEMPTDDPLFGRGYIRVDGRKMHDMYLYEVKSPAESREEWDLYKLREVIPAEQAFAPLDRACPLVKT